MTPRINYTYLASKKDIEMKIIFTLRKKTESTESTDQIKREQTLQRVTYQRESEIPKSPLESQTYRTFSTIKDVVLIPFFKAGSYPPKTIKVTNLQIAPNDEFLKIFQQSAPPPPPPPPPSMPLHSQYPQILSHSSMPQPLPPSIYSHPMHHSMQYPIPHSTTHSMTQPLTHSMPQSSLQRAGPLPSAPIHPYNAMNSHIPTYDSSLLTTSIDPYNMINKSKILYNPITKKPQNYKTVPCRRFHSTDGCERGDNCHFIHDFQFQGRPTPNFHDWKNNNTMNQKNLQTINGYPVGIPNYYPPPGPETHNNGS